MYIHLNIICLEWSKETAREASKMIESVVRITMDTSSVDEENRQKHSKLVSILAPELISPIEAVRNCAHRLLTLLWELTSLPIKLILSQYRDKLMAPVLRKQNPKVKGMGIIKCEQFKPQRISNIIFFLLRKKEKER